ncbi:hypothetical protein FOA52_001546 [Chlamydomonas sp. UWO 241]|nr:hypothetical protein FOA52_001546 [Chlamydomonas sp. UWO 241]
MEVAPEVRKAIVAAFVRMMGRQPHEYEVAMYSSMESEKSIIDKLRASSEFKSKGAEWEAAVSTPIPPPPVPPNFEIRETYEDQQQQQQQALAAVDLETKLAHFKHITVVFLAAGRGSPSIDELNLYAYKLLQDPNFSLEDHLGSHPVDTSYAVIDGMYEKINNTLPAADMRAFLKRKLVEFRLDTDRFEKFLKDLHSMETADSAAAAAAAIVEEPKTEPVEVQAEAEDVISPDPDPLGFNTPINSCLAKNSYDGPRNFVDPLYEGMKQFQGIGKLAAVQTEHNISELRYTTKANSYSYNMGQQLKDGDAGPFDKYMDLPRRNTKYGAFLADAHDTKIGSIMSPFLYKELYGEGEGDVEERGRCSS